MDFVEDYLVTLTKQIALIDRAKVELIVDLVWQNYLEDRRLVFCGNGGSAACASHLPADFQKNVFVEGGRPWECLSLVDSVPLMTAWSNDTSYANVFAGQARCWLREGDILIAISGSGNSANVIAAVDAAHDVGAITVGWSGYGGGKLAQRVHHALVLPSHNMQMIEDMHMIIGHLIFTEMRFRLQAVKLTEPQLSLR